MAFRTAQQTRVYAGILAAAGYARTASTTSATDMHDTTVLTDTSKQMIPGSDTGTFSIAGPLDSDASANGQFDALTDQKSSTGIPVTYLPLGSDGHAWLIDTIQTSFDTVASHSGTVDWTLDAQTTGITDFRGVILEDNTAVTIDTDGTTHTGPAGGTANGAVFHLHVTAWSGFTSDDIIIEGSTSGAWAGEETTIATFTQVTGLTSERVEVTGVVPRYLRVVDDVTGTGSITHFVAAARR